jgi:hypothetical protein
VNVRIAPLAPRAERRASDRSSPPTDVSTRGQASREGAAHSLAYAPLQLTDRVVEEKREIVRETSPRSVVAELSPRDVVAKSSPRSVVAAVS